LGASTSRGPADLPEGIRNEASTSAATNVAELDALYHDLSSYQPEPAGGVKEAEKTVATEPLSLSAGSAGEMSVVSLTLPILITTGLRIITSPTSPTLVVEPVLPEVVTSPTSIVVSVLVSMKTPPRSPAIPRSPPASVSATSSTVMTVKPVEALSSGTTRSRGVIEAEQEFVAEIVDSFYKSLKRSVALVLKGSTTSFSTLKVVLSRNIKSI